MNRFILLALLVSTSTAIAAGAYAEQQPIHITANTLDVNHAKGQAIFQGNVKITQGDVVLTANRVEAQYTAAPTTLVATGDVALTRGTERATGDKAIYNPNTQTLTLTGNRVVLQRGPSQLVGDNLTYNLSNQMARVTRQGGPVEATFLPQ